MKHAGPSRVARAVVRGNSGNLGFLLQCRITQVEKKRQAERNSYAEHRDDHQPPVANSKTLALDSREPQQGDRRDDDIHAEECADSVGKQLVGEQDKVQSMLEYPGNKL